MEKVEKVARALCQADGVKPDETFQTNELISDRTPNSFAMDYVRKPNWSKYEKEARRFLAALAASNED